MYLYSFICSQRYPVLDIVCGLICLIWSALTCPMWPRLCAVICYLYILIVNFYLCYCIWNLPKLPTALWWYSLFCKFLFVLLHLCIWNLLNVPTALWYYSLFGIEISCHCKLLFICVASLTDTQRRERETKKIWGKKAAGIRNKILSSA